MSRLENAPSRTEIARMMGAMVDLFCASWKRAPASIILDIDDTFRCGSWQAAALTVQRSLRRTLLSAHPYLRRRQRQAGGGDPARGKTPTGVEVRTILKHVIARIRRHWPKVQILVRGDSHYGRSEAMDWCESNDV